MHKKENQGHDADFFSYVQYEAFVWALGIRNLLSYCQKSAWRCFFSFFIYIIIVYGKKDVYLHVKTQKYIWIINEIYQIYCCWAWSAPSLSAILMYSLLIWTGITFLRRLKAVILIALWYDSCCFGCLSFCHYAWISRYSKHIQ